MPFQSPEIATWKKSVVAAGMRLKIPQSLIANPCHVWCWLGCGQFSRAVHPNQVHNLTPNHNFGVNPASRAVLLRQPSADELAMARAVIAFKMSAMDDFDRQIIDAFHGSAVVVSI